jgi:hypothetical protein
MYFFGDDDDTIWMMLKCSGIVFWIMLINFCSSFLVLDVADSFFFN